jgi:hypothetical protein
MADQPFDLLGDPLTLPKLPKPNTSKPRHRKVVADTTLRLPFEEFIEALKAPLLPIEAIPKEHRSDRPGVPVPQDPAVEDEGDPGPDIPYEPWGAPWFQTHHSANTPGAVQLQWAEYATHFLRIKLFWESLEELTLSNNEREKLSVLKWVFQPDIQRFYYYQRPTVCVHVNDIPFSFHNCCLAVGMDEDVIREGVRRNVPPKLMAWVEKLLNASQCGKARRMTS